MSRFVPHLCEQIYTHQPYEANLNHIDLVLSNNNSAQSSMELQTHEYTSLHTFGLCFANIHFTYMYMSHKSQQAKIESQWIVLVHGENENE